MPKRKELGVRYHTACRACRADLWVGWLADFPGGAAPDAQGMVLGPLACPCGQTTLTLNPRAPGRAVVAWATAEEPVVGTTTVHGSLRDRAR